MEVSLVSLNMTMSGRCSLIIQSRYLCFFSALIPLTFHMSTASDTLVTAVSPLSGWASHEVEVCNGCGL